SIATPVRAWEVQPKRVIAPKVRQFQIVVAEGFTKGRHCRTFGAPCFDGRSSPRPHGRGY
ncbi:MAG: hypothetical protein ACR2H6_06120, partial [Pyrinomonadaceae bacterium]